MLEYATYGENYYGTPVGPVKKLLEEGKVKLGSKIKTNHGKINELPEITADRYITDWERKHSTNYITVQDGFKISSNYVFRKLVLDSYKDKPQKFIDKHFAGIDLVYAKEESNILFSSYEVRLANGAKLEFSNKGNWEEVDCQSNEVPAAIIPQPIRAYVSKNYPAEKILMIEKNRNDYEVKLSNRLELKFDKNFNIYDIDD